MTSKLLVFANLLEFGAQELSARGLLAKSTTLGGLDDRHLNAVQMAMILMVQKSTKLGSFTRQHLSSMLVVFHPAKTNPGNADLSQHSSIGIQRHYRRLNRLFWLGIAGIVLGPVLMLIVAAIVYQFARSDVSSSIGLCSPFAAVTAIAVALRRWQPSNGLVVSWAQINPRRT